MKDKIFYSVLLLLLPFLVNAQVTSVPDSLVLHKMKKLDWLKGEWSGEGWISINGEQHFFEQEEIISVKVKGTVFLIEGIGRDKVTSGLVHEAFAVLSYDMMAGKYLMRAFKSDGRYIDAKVSVSDDSTLVWGFQIDLNPEIRYTIRQEEGQWRETGEFSLSGTKWTKFYEMRLRRK